MEDGVGEREVGAVFRLAVAGGGAKVDVWLEAVGVGGASGATAAVERVGEAETAEPDSPLMHCIANFAAYCFAIYTHTSVFSNNFRNEASGVRLSRPLRYI